MSRMYSAALCALIASTSFAQFPGQPGPAQQPPAQPPMQQPGAQPGPGGAPNAMGDLANAPAPAWLKEGVRLTYKASAGQEGMGAPPGLVTIDVVSVARGEAGLDVRIFADPSGRGALTIAHTAGVVTPAAAGEYWISPQALQRMAQQPPAGVTVQPAQLQLQGKNVSVIVVDSQQAGRSVYDAQSGVLMQSRNAQSSQDLLDMRERKLPWTEGRPPSWLAKTKQLTYTGQVMMNQPGMPPQASNVSARFDVVGVGANLMAMKRVVTFDQGNGMGQPGPEAIIVAGASQSMGLWVPPLGLKQLRQGQVLDEDKTTGARLSVQAVGRMPYGRNAVTLVEEAQGYMVYGDYELETGILLFTTFIDKSSGMSTQLMFTDRR